MLEKLMYYNQTGIYKSHTSGSKASNELILTLW